MTQIYKIGTQTEFEALQEKINRMVVTPAKKTTKKETKETEAE